MTAFFYWGWEIFLNQGLGRKTRQNYKKIPTKLQLRG